MKNLLSYLFVATSFWLQAQTFEQTKEFLKLEGLFEIYYDESSDKMLMKVDQLDREFLYVNSLSSGIGSNDIGLDRGQLGNEQVVSFKKMGNKLFMIQPNLYYRAITDNQLEKASVEQAFAKSVLYGFDILDQNSESYLIDISSFVKRDSHGVSNRLARMNQGSYKLDLSKSAINLDRTRSFPKNTEIDVMLTFSGDAKGYYIRSVSPNSNLVTVATHHSFIELPDDNYKMRIFDPRSGAYSYDYMDYASPVQEPILKRFTMRHRLEKKNPNAAVSEAVEPIVYYLDNGTPEPVRSALLEGGSWWNQAFEAIGYKDAFQVKMLPDDADPLDVRYNVIQWVHRSTRGWSYGASVADPRTGEIIKGHVSLGSLRIRQDFMIAQALANKPFADADDNDQKMLDMALARIRQLSAHEIGHTLGFLHNYAASAAGNISVMDYPHPQVNLEGDQIDYSKAYETGIGAWDKVSVAYSYSDFGMDESKVLPKLTSILEDAKSKGLWFITDQDARPASSAHANAHLWDNGKDIIAELDAMLALRAKAIDNFSVDNIRTGEPLSVLEDVFVPLYLYHRYQTEAVAKVIGGMVFDYQVKGSNQDAMKVVSAKRQRLALKSLLKTIDANTIAVPKEKLSLFPPRAYGYARGRESFKSKTGASFDPFSAAETAADITFSFVLNPERASRLIQQKALDPNQLGLDEVIDQLIDQTVKRSEKSLKDQYLIETNRIISFRLLDHLMALSSNSSVYGQVNAIASKALLDLSKSLSSDDQFSYEMKKRIADFFDNKYQFKLPETLQIPDGSPIGMDCFN